QRVVAGTIAGEFERPAPGQIVHRTPFARVGFGALDGPPLHEVAELLTRFGCACRFEPDEVTLLWSKLVMLAPMALNTTASGWAVGELWADPEWAQRFEACAREACAVATALGASVDGEATVRLLRSFPATL